MFTLKTRMIEDKLVELVEKEVSKIYPDLDIDITIKSQVNSWLSQSLYLLSEKMADDLKRLLFLGATSVSDILIRQEQSRQDVTKLLQRKEGK